MTEHRKYRGMTKEGEWVVGWYVGYNQHLPTKRCDMIFKPDNTKRFLQSFHHVLPASVSQSTGLFDKNGVEIFGGDEIEWEHETMEEDTGATYPIKSDGKVVFDEYYHYIIDSDCDGWQSNPPLGYIFQDYAITVEVLPPERSKE